MDRPPGERVRQRRVLVGLALLLPTAAVGGLVGHLLGRPWLDAALQVGFTLVIGLAALVLDWLWERRLNRRVR